MDRAFCLLCPETGSQGWDTFRARPVAAQDVAGYTTRCPDPREPDRWLVPSSPWAADRIGSDVWERAQTAALGTTFVVNNGRGLLIVAAPTLYDW